MNEWMLGMIEVSSLFWILLLLLLLLASAIGIILLLIRWSHRGNISPAPPPVPPNPPPTPPASESASCSRCGSALPATAPQGLCPRCVLGVGVTTQTDVSGELGPRGTKIVPPPETDVARRFPHLEILGLLGQGGMGVVYKARQARLNRLVALKILTPEKGAEPKFAERFQREAQALARLNHPNIVAVHDYGEADGMFFLVMEYVDGMTLRQLLRNGQIKPEEALAIVPPICQALQFAHEQGVVHRDIKPENVLLDKQGRVKIADFGIAKLLGADPPHAALTEERSVIGTPHYMAPEQVEQPHRVDHRADIYSLGVVFYEMLTGELPLGRFLPPSRKIQMDVRLDEVVLHALEKEPDRRYQKASQIRTDVETIASGPGPVSGNPNHKDTELPVPIPAIQKQVRAPALGLIAAAVAQLILCLSLFVFAIPAIEREGGDMGGYVAVGSMASVSFIAAMVVLSGAIHLLRLKRHLLVVVASVVAMVSGPAAILGFPFGLWALLVLNRREVRQAFQPGAPQQPVVNQAPPPFNPHSIP